MNTSRFASVVLATLLNFAPFLARTVPSLPSLVSSPASILFKWILGAVAVTGTMHTVSAATARLVSASSISGQVGTRLSYQIKINDGQNRQPGSWTVAGKNLTSSGTTTNGLPGGLSMALSTGIISGTPTLAGTYPVTITAYEHSNRSGGKLTFTLTFNITGNATPPGFATIPVGGTVTEGGAFTFTASATGDAPLTYQWSHGISAIPGATSPTLTLSPVLLSDAGTYTVTVRNGAGSAVSPPVTLVVNAAVITTAITRQPADTTLHPGDTLSLTVAATGTEPLSYVWKQDGLAVAVAPNSPTLSLVGADASRAGTWTVEISGPGGNATSVPVHVTFVPLSLHPPALDAQGLRLTADTIPGRAYVLEYSPSMLAGSWLTAREFSATSAATDLLQSIGSSPAQFWRYHAVP